MPQDHFYTSDDTERDNAVANLGYQKEGEACYVYGLPAGTMPLHRLVNPRTGGHFYTLSDAERDAVTAFGYAGEGEACYALRLPAPGTMPLHRLFNPQSGDYFYTLSNPERDNAIAGGGYFDGGVACFAFPQETPLTTPLKPLHRVYNPNNARHFYTTNDGERDDAIHKDGYINNEGEACVVWSSPGGTVPLHRLVNPQTGQHFYTTNNDERDSAIAKGGLASEGEACFVFPPQTATTAGLTAFHRLYSPQNGEHLFTTSDAERDNVVVNLGYTNELEACYVFSSPAPGTTAFHRLFSGNPLIGGDFNTETDWIGIHVCLSHAMAQQIATTEVSISKIVDGISKAAPGLAGIIIEACATYIAVHALLLQVFDKGRGVCLLLPWAEVVSTGGNTSVWFPSTR